MLTDGPTIDPDALRRMLRNVSVKVVDPRCMPKSCRTIAFDITLRSGILTGPGRIPVDWQVTDEIAGVPTVVAEGRVFFRRESGTLHQYCELPMPEDATFTSDFTNTLTVKVDPHGMYYESSEADNVAHQTATCVG